MKYNIKWTKFNEDDFYETDSIFGSRIVLEFNGDNWWNAYIFDHDDEEIKSICGASTLEKAKFQAEEYIRNEINRFLGV